MSAIRTLEVIIKDFKKIKNLKTEVNGCNVFLRGPNGVGKSSFMDFIEIAFGKSTIVPPNTNIEGQVIIDKDGNQYKFDVKLDSKGKPKVTVTMPDGNKDTSKSVIAGIIGVNAFDIDNFVNLSTTEAGRKKQVEEFKKFLDDETRLFLSKYETSVKTNFDERTDLNRDITKLEGAIKLHPMINHTHELTKFTETKTEDVLAELKKAQSHNEKVKKVISNIEERNEDVEKALFEISELETKILALRSEVEAKGELTKQAQEWLKTNSIKPVDVLEQKITDAGRNNQDYLNAQNLIKEMAALSEIKNEANKLTETIESERQMIKDAIRDMEGPIQGLAFDEDQLLYNNIPVHPSSLSKSEIKKLGIRLKIAENPDLPLFIHEAECMDEDSLKEIQDLADECGLQMFAEEVQRGGSKELQIEIVAFN
jgi:chromosome segregation ATPase